ncbi:Peptidoglycan-binding domain protein [Fulvivirga imtechensis AK7]|uniref:Peptidoglycan-binding domain protein n=1 Tax=Fulvivirga imtechensis AK7 TaxID=1237149 RepID=L8JN69_9BACT|nr:L,D-transpeptidase family protein [Fulvivirga imtechensis]ELR69668.1 Peptidoglycan-binding domain protein [Fulvivirga imtechensis AK7]
MKTLLTILIYILSGTLHAQSDKISNNEIRRIIELKQYNIDGELMFCKKTLPEFYFDRAFKPAWTNDDNISELIEQIKLAENEGLNTSDYHYEYLKTNYTGMHSLTPEMDILLTDAYLLFASHLIAGKVDPVTLNAEWRATRKETNLKKLLAEALDNIEIARSLNSLKPTYKTYVRLKSALKSYRKIKSNGGWPRIPEGESIKPKATDPRIPLIRKRLAVTGLLAHEPVADSLVYDAELESAVKVFQKKNGLEADGVIGKGTFNVMNETVDKRIQQIILNMERCRWLPLDMGAHYILVNIANYELEVVKNNELQLEMDVVVGKPYRKTPVFSQKMLYIVFNPYWTIPPTILHNDIIPAVRNNLNYLRKNNIKVIKGNTEIDPSSINWAEAKPGNFPYQLRQDPGLDNALGVVKFMFPNPYNVYMHDTNHRELFSKTDRALSSGCIRLSRPIDLAVYLLKDHPAEWTEERINKVIGKDKNYTVMLAEEVDVHILYWTAFVDENGSINFRKDIYDRDEVLWRALQKSPPSI